MVGHLAEMEIPTALRKPILGSYVKLVGCNMSEAKQTDIESYKSLSELFQRQLKWDSRPIDRDADLVSDIRISGDIASDTIGSIAGEPVRRNRAVPG